MEKQRKSSPIGKLTRRNFLRLTATAAAAGVSFGGVTLTHAITNPEMFTRYSNEFEHLLPPSESTIAELINLYLNHDNKAQFLMALATYEKEVAVAPEDLSPTGSGEHWLPNSSVVKVKDFVKLAESLLLFERLLLNEQDRLLAVRRVYQHYCINTDGPIPLKDAEDSFDVFDWIKEYGELFNIEFELVEEGGASPIETLMKIDDPAKPVRCGSFDRLNGWSGARSLRMGGRLLNQARYGRSDVIPSMLFTFEPNTTKYNITNALCLSEYSQLAYMKEAYVQKFLKSTHLGFDEVHWIEDQKTDTQGFVAVKENYIVVSFRGTKEPRDFLTDLKIRKKPFLSKRLFRSAPKGRVHRGFNGAFESIKKDLDAVLDTVEDQRTGRPIFVTGHSLGAAVAQLAACYLSENRNIASVYTFGSPRVGDEKFSQHYERQLKDRTFLHINNSDIVTKIPMRLLGFRHVALPARQFDENHALTELSEVTEDAAEGMSNSAIREANKKMSIQAAEQIALSQAYTSIEELTDIRTSPVYSSSTEFNSGMVSDHGISQYLFKFACAIVDDKLSALG